MTETRGEAIAITGAEGRGRQGAGSDSVPLRIALVNPSADAISETFVRAHRFELAGEVLFFTGHPHFLDLAGQASIPARFEKSRALLRRITGIGRDGFHRVLAARERALADAFLREGIQVALAEYGPTGCFILPACRAAGVPLVVHFHGFDASRRTILEEFGARYRQLFAHAAAIVSVSRAMTEALVGLGAPREKILYSPCGPADTFFEIDPDRGSRRVLSAGRFVEKKGPLHTLLAFAAALPRSPDATLTMVGEGPLLEPARALARELGIEESVAFPGARSHEEVRQLMAESALFVQHSLVAPDGDSEGTPVAVMEAQAAALPVVATRHAGIPDVVVHGETGLLVGEGDIEGMGDAMATLLADPTTAKRYGEAGRRQVRDSFSRARHLAQLNELLVSVARPAP